MKFDNLLEVTLLIIILTSVLYLLFLIIGIKGIKNNRKAQGISED